MKLKTAPVYEIKQGVNVILARYGTLYAKQKSCRY